MDLQPSQGFTIGNYTSLGRKDLLGRGTFAEVYKGENNVTKEIVAVKVIDIARLTKGSDKLKKHLASEIIIMKKLDHPNIVRLFDVFTPSESHIYMMFEYCSGGDFAKYLSKRKRLSEERAQHWMRHLGSGLKFLRSLNIIHRDLKPQNLLLSSTDEDTALLKIADFGFARFIEPQSVADTVCGSPLYMAPEILKMQKYSIKTDLWSVGAILYEMLTGQPPFPARSVPELVQMINNRRRVDFSVTLKLSNECTSLVESLLQQDPTNRISWEEFFMHPWLNLHQSLEISPNSSYYLNIANMSSTPPTTITTPRVEVVNPRSRNSLSTTPDGISSRSRTNSLLDMLHPQGMAIPKVAQPTGQEYSISLPTHLSSQKPMSSPPMAFQRAETYVPPSSFGGVPITPFGRESFDKDYVVLGNSDDSEESVINEVRRRGKRVEAVASLAEQKVETDAQLDGLILYIKSLVLLQGAIEHIKKLNNTESLELNNVLNNLRELFHETLVKAENLRQRLQSNVPEQVTLSTEKLMYDFALQMGREGGVQELLKNYEKSEQMYESGLLLLEQVYLDVSDDQDKKIIRNYIESFDKRLKEVRTVIGI